VPDVSGIDDAKEKLPMPALLHQLGLGDRAKKSARCPLPGHEDNDPSFGIFKTHAGAWQFKCFSCNSGGDEIEFLRQYENLANGAAIKRYLELAGANGSRPKPRTFRQVKAVMQRGSATKPPQAFDWQACVDAFTPEHEEGLCEWRGFSPAFVSWLRAEKLIGLQEGGIAFPVHEKGKVVAAHVRAKEGSWRYSPSTKTRPLVIGELLPGDPVHIFESQWDAFAFMDMSGIRDGIIITRGASNGALVADLIPQGATVYVWPQNDAPGQKWAKDVCNYTKCAVKSAKTLARFADLNEWTKDGGATDKHLLDAMMNAEILREAERPLIEFRSPLQLKNFTPPPGLVLAGNFHIVKGSVFVIGGAPGIGKSRAAVALAVAGATGHEWFGLILHRKFKTMIVQTENGEFRLAREFAELDCDALEKYVRVCPPPPYGLCFGRDGFREQLAAAVADFGPDVVIYDPWNAAAREQDSREYLDTFDALKSVLPIGDDAPALGIVAHTRKPRADERASGRALLNLLAGSYVLGSVPRTVFVMQPASDDTMDNRIVWTCCKNNDGEIGARSAWERSNGLFAPVIDFDWQTFDAPNSDRRQTITETDVAEVFADGPLSKTEAAKRLQESTGASKATAYRALDLNGRFRKHLRLENGLWK
jgi:AAA domain/CHC2 zinc finger